MSFAFDTDSMWTAPRSPADQIFKDFAPLIAADLGLNWEGGAVTAEAVWNLAFESADSFRKKGSMVKTSTWFSWNQCAKEQLSDWHTFKMVLTDHEQSKGCVPNEEEKDNETKDHEMLAAATKRRKNNESRNWQLLKQTAGAFPLAFKIFTPELHTHVLMLQMATRPLWNWYTRQVTEIKTQFDAIDYAISMMLPLEEEGYSWMGEQ